MTCNFRIGQKVVCVDTNWVNGLPHDGETLPVLNGIYTVREKRLDSNGVSLRLREIVNPVCERNDGSICEVSFFAWHFRPLVKPKRRRKTKTDISLFLGMLDRTPAAAKRELKRLREAA